MEQLRIEDDIIRTKFLKEMEKVQKYCKKQKKIMEELLGDKHAIQIVLMIKPIGEKNGEHQ